MTTHCDQLISSRPARCQYGNLESVIRGIRHERPMDITAVHWRESHTDGTFQEWQEAARACLRDGLQAPEPRLDLQAETLSIEARDGFQLERIAFNTAPWSRVNGYLLLPTNVKTLMPGLVLFHEWGGPMLFGKERIVNSGRDHPSLVEHRRKYHSGEYLAEVFARAGYAVVTIDAHHFGERIPFGLNGIPPRLDPFNLAIDEFVVLDLLVKQQLYLGIRQLNWAGTTWAGINFLDDRRTVDYLLSRPEVDQERIGCTGLSGGGWRTNILAALDPRIKAAVSACWMTTGDYQQIYNVDGAIGTFCLLPGVWRHLDVPDLTIMSAPCASMVINTSEDELFPPEGQLEAARQICAGYEWAGCTQKFHHNNPLKGHCYDADLQRDAISWFNDYL